MKYILFALPVSLLVSCAQSGQSSENASPVVVSEAQMDTASNVIKVFVFDSGEITANGKDISLEALDLRLQQLKKTAGMVYYSRENITDNPTKASMQIMDLVVKYELPLQFYMDNTFKQAAMLN
jgi:biopolymer transport protein ExbD